MRSHDRIICIVMSFALLSGCGNAWESLTIGGWTEMGENEGPQVDYPAGQWDYNATTITEGKGPLIVPGDLVQVKMRELGRKGEATNDQHKFWLYVGRQKGKEIRQALIRDGEFGYLGSIRIRRALIGHRVGEKFSLRAPPEKKDQELVELIPFKGVIGNTITPIPEVAAKMPPRGTNKAQLMNRWHLGEWSPQFLTEVEIVRSCKAKLLIRTDRLRQWGKVVIIPNPEGHGYLDSRAGELKHIAIEAQCEDPAPIRFQAGPYYEAGGEQRSGAGKLWDWEHSYMRTSNEPFVAPLSDDYYDMRTRRIVSGLDLR